MDVEEVRTRCAAEFFECFSCACVRESATRVTECRAHVARRQRPAQSCFTEDTFVTSIRRFEEMHQEAREEQMQRIGIENQSQLTGCDEWVELHIANVHGGSISSMVLHNLRTTYKRDVAALRQNHKRPYSVLENEPDNSEDPEQLVDPGLRLKPEDAVLCVDMSASRTRANSHAGWGFVTVANRQVADLLVQASLKNTLNCAPPTKSLLKAETHRNAVLTYSNIRRNPRDIELAKVGLPACGFGVVEVLRNDEPDDCEESSPDGTAADNAQRKPRGFSVLWETTVTEACICQLKKRLELRYRIEAASCGDAPDTITITRICIDLCSISSAKTLSDARGMFLALRLRHPPDLTHCVQQRNVLDSGVVETTPPKFDIIMDPSGEAGAFGSPTAFHCLRFARKKDYEEATGLLQKAQVRVFSTVHEIVAVPLRQRPGSHKLCAHRLPNEHTPQGNLKKLLYPLFAVDRATDEVQELKSRVQHALEGLLVHGNLRAADLPEFLSKLRMLWQSEAISSVPHVLEQLEAELPSVKNCNDGTAALTQVAMLYDNLQAKEARIRQREVDEAHQQCRLDSSCSSGGSGAVARSGAVPSASDQAAQSHGAAAEASAGGANASTGSRARVPVRTTEDILQDPALQLSLRREGYSDNRMQDVAPLKDKEELPGLVRTRRVVITPLRVILHPPQLEETNRILRQYSKWTYRFLRANFATDSLGAISLRHLSPDVRNYVRSILTQGLRLSGRTFKFLGWSNSQLKSHSVWLYTEDGRDMDNAPTAAEIRGQAGELQGIRVPAKFASRLGLCFSSTYATCSFPASAICTLPDLMSPRGGMLTDGVGVITTEGMKAVIEALPVSKQKIGHKAGDVSAIQVRIGGSKGVLARWDNLPHMTEGKLVGVRKSMRKFEVTHSMLDVEVCSVAKVMPCAINRQVMMALLSLGLGEQILWRYYEAHVKDLDHLLEGGERALLLLRTMGCVDPTNHSDAHLPAGCLAACMVAAGIRPEEDGLLKSLVAAYRGHALKNIVEKCRLPVKDGVVLMGVFDETGTLQSGTFWASFEAPEDNCTMMNDDSPSLEPMGPIGLPANTRAVVGRAPVMAPGDLRLLKAADPRGLDAALLSMHNVIVFPRTGTESEPSKMGGGDLDGDCFFIIWDPDLVPKEEAPALNYSASEKREPPRTVIDRVQPTDVVDFFLNYIVNDQLGRIADAHLALADASPALANNERCMQLVDLHTVAVDFAKTGVPVDPAKVGQLMRGVQFPDYMNGLRKSTTMIGKISRDARRRTGGVGALAQQALDGPSSGDADGSTGSAGTFTLPERPVDSCYVLPGSAAHLQWAAGMVQEWTIQLSQLMCRYTLTDVGQVLAGRVMDFQGAHGKEKAQESQQRLNRHVAQLMHGMRKKCFPDDATADAIACTDTRITDDPHGEAASSSRSELMAMVRGIKALEKLGDDALALQLRKVSALYQAAHSTPETSGTGRCVSRHEMLVRQSLPWCVAAGVLVRMRTHKLE